MPKEEKKKRKHSLFREYYEAILVAVIFASFVKVFIFQTYKIPTQSMVPTLLVGDHLIVNKFSFRDPGLGFLDALFPASDVKRGDIIVFKYPEDPRVMFVKRAIGMPGDIVAITDKTVYINGKPLEDPWAHYLMEDGHRPVYVPTRVPENMIFALGDNRDHSRDSRFWGFVPRDNILGTPWLIYWSYEAPPYNPRESVSQKTRNFFNVFFTFFSKTRWARSFTFPR
ncbi:MAG TPA: signal peptidase I [Thermoanaerobaculia bacterium]|nr:signal peptidase I [Thermoanaerobaculia bacterium]HUM29312.1 signal peptidase I [Thermoanaerobaculia bacterium]HXK67730.1 signal peptidase I [Thermoanaerobaculia bacterium]